LTFHIGLCIVVYFYNLFAHKMRRLFVFAPLASIHTRLAGCLPRQPSRLDRVHPTGQGSGGAQSLEARPPRHPAAPKADWRPLAPRRGSVARDFKPGSRKPSSRCSERFRSEVGFLGVSGILRGLRIPTANKAGTLQKTKRLKKCDRDQ
jgi:hypothetical protein